MKTAIKIFIFIDESGTLPDPEDRFVVLVAVATQNPQILSRFRGKSKKETKFYLAGEKTRRIYLAALAKESVAIFTLGVDKNTQKIPDSPENYAVLSWLLLLDCLAYFGRSNLEVVFDRHFHREVDEKRLFGALEKLLGVKLKVRSGDSTKEPGIMAADMVAGAFLYSQSGKSEEFYALIGGKIISEKIIHWKEAKKKFVETLKKLARTGVNTHPSED